MEKHHIQWENSRKFASHSMGAPSAPVGEEDGAGDGRGHRHPVLPNAPQQPGGSRLALQPWPWLVNPSGEWGKKTWDHGYHLVNYLT